MIRRLTAIISLLSILPMGIVGLYIYTIKQNQHHDFLQSRIKTELNISAESFSGFINERLREVDLWGALTVPVTALEFERPEALSRLLTQLVGRPAMYDSILVLDRKFEFFAINEQHSPAGINRFDFLTESLPELVGLAKKVFSTGEDAGIHFADAREGMPEIFLYRVIRDRHGELYGYLLAKVAEKTLMRQREQTAVRLEGFLQGPFQVSIRQKWPKPRVGMFDYCGSKSDKVANFCFSASESILSYDWRLFLMISVVTLTLFYFVFRGLITWVVKGTTQPLYSFLETFSAASSGGNVERISLGSRYNEIQQLERSANDVIERLADYQDELKKSERSKALGEVARQVAHDIRSPLTALEMISKDKKPMNEEKKSLLRSATRRIYDIADNLIVMHRSQKKNDKAGDVLLSGLLLSLLAEKRTQFRTASGLDFDYELNAENFGLFVHANGPELTRVLSNIINNAVEAMNHAGRVFVQAALCESGNVQISVSDSGKGISASDLRRVFDEGFTSGKSEGSGLGLHYAKEKTESWGGKISASSVQGKGTTVAIHLRRAEAPSWFAKEIEIPEDGKVVILDDHEFIHEVWKENVSAISNVELIHFYKTEDFKEWYSAGGKTQKWRGLFDYELSGSVQTGLDVIAELKVGSKVTLVTSRADENEILKRCQAEGVKLLPKDMALYVQIRSIDS